MDTRRGELSDGWGRWTAAMAAMALLGVAGCSSRPHLLPPDELAMLGQGIVGGEETEGWPAVGMYLIDGGYGGACTATYVHETWLVTASHCVENAGTGDVFFVGHDIEDYSFGDFKNIAEAIEHPAYDMSQNHPHDIALLRLFDGLPDVDPIPLNLDPITDDWLGVYLHYVGFGSDTYYNGPGSGLKRETDLELVQYTPLELLVYTPGTSTCTGDSGGPAFLERDGEAWVVGVVSGGFAVEQGQDACEGASFEMRTDAELNFIDDYFDPSETPPVPWPEETGDDDDDDDDTPDFEDLPEPHVDEGEYEPLRGIECDAAGSGDVPPLAWIGGALLAGAVAARRARRGH